MLVVALPILRHRMGGTTSKRRHHKDLGPWRWEGPPGDHSGYPQELVLYPGDELLYCYVDIITKYNIMRNTMNLGHAVVTTNVEEFLDDLRACYKEGFVLNHFVRIPCAKTTIEIQNWADPYPYQAIFSRPAYRHPAKNDWELVIEKKILSTRLLSTAEYEEKRDLINTIHEKAKEGARLVCAQPVGYVRSGTTNMQYAVMGVDLFFNVPKNPGTVRHCYHTIKLPVKYTIVPDATQSLQQIESNADWMGQLKVFLDKGWKLVDICIDATALADAFGMKDTSKTMDTIWIFEKPLDKLDDFNPAYEGAIIEYYHKSKKHFKGERPKKDWRPVIAGMGVSGWELATIIQTPYLLQSSFTTYTMKLLMIFQRPYIPEHQEATQKVRLKIEQEELEKSQRTYNRMGLSISSKGRSSSVPEHISHCLLTDQNRSPTMAQKSYYLTPNQLTPDSKRSVDIRPVKRAESSDAVLENYPQGSRLGLNHQNNRYLNPHSSKMHHSDQTMTTDSSPEVHILPSRPQFQRQENVKYPDPYPQHIESIIPHEPIKVLSNQESPRVVQLIDGSPRVSEIKQQSPNVIEKVQRFPKVLDQLPPMTMENIIRPRRDSGNVPQSPRLVTKYDNMSEPCVIEHTNQSPVMGYYDQPQRAMDKPQILMENPHQSPKVVGNHGNTHEFPSRTEYNPFFPKGHSNHNPVKHYAGQSDLDQTAQQFVRPFPLEPNPFQYPTHWPSQTESSPNHRSREFYQSQPPPHVIPTHGQREQMQENPTDVFYRNSPKYSVLQEPISGYPEPDPPQARPIKVVVAKEKRSKPQFYFPPPPPLDNSTHNIEKPVAKFPTTPDDFT